MNSPCTAIQSFKSSLAGSSTAFFRSSPALRDALQQHKQQAATWALHLTTQCSKQSCKHMVTCARPLPSCGADVWAFPPRISCEDEMSTGNPTRYVRWVGWVGVELFALSLAKKAEKAMRRVTDASPGHRNMWPQPRDLTVESADRSEHTGRVTYPLILARQA